MKKLVIVESPAKIKTIQKHLNSLKAYGFQIIATRGHITNLDENSMSIRLKNGKFIGDFQVLKEKKKLVEEIKKLVRNSDEVYVCTDDDREGERIADDVVHICKIKKYFRVTFTEITKKAIELALVKKHNIRLINEQIVLAQWTRRMIDRIIGYGFSPVITYIFKKNNTLSYKNSDGEIVSAKSKGTGRVIAISLSLLAKRREEIEDYNERGATLTDVVVANYVYDGVAFSARGKGLEFKKENSDEMQKVVHLANYKIHRVYERTRDMVESVPPHPPFTTASLYSACSFIYELDSKKTKKITQDLYESGYINYPRTDNIELSDDIVNNLIGYLFEIFSDKEKEDILKTKRKYKQTSKFAQEAHEAIRPTFFSTERDPKNILGTWSRDDNAKKFNNYHKLVYELIWYRTLCTQLKDSQYDRNEIVIKAGDHTFSVKANDRFKDGWEKHYYGELIKETAKGSGNEDWRHKRVVIPSKLAKGTIIENVNVSFYEKTTHAPKRISEGALITRLTKMGVARPSTLHSIVESLVTKKYAESHKTLLDITDLGMEIYKITEQYLSFLNDADEARKFENLIEDIEKGDIMDVHSVLMEYWNLVEEFKKEVGYEEISNRKPTEKQIKFAKSIYNKLSEDVKQSIQFDEITSSFIKISNFINNYKNL